MEKDKAYILDDRGYIFIEGKDSEEFLQNIVSNDVNKIRTKGLIFASILSPQGKYLYEFFIIRYLNKYLIECDKVHAKEIFDLLNSYKLRSKITINESTEKYVSFAVNFTRFNDVKKQNKTEENFFVLDENIFFLDPRLERLGGRIIVKLEKLYLVLKQMNLVSEDKLKFFSYCFKEGVPSVNLHNLKNNLFGVECNLEELNGLDFKKGCFIGQENTARINIRNKLRKRLMPVKIIEGSVKSKEIIKFNDLDVGKILIDNPFAFAVVNVLKPKFDDFEGKNLKCENGIIQIFKPEWLKI